MKKKKIVHIIDSLGRGGAEILLVGIVNSLPQFEHIIISLKPINEFVEELAGTKIFFLNFSWYHSIPKTVNQVKSIIKLNKVDIVHSNLFWSVIVSRLATPSHIKLINSYHALLYGSEGANYPFYAQWLDKLTYRSRIIIICVSNGVQENLRKNLGLKQNIRVLHNFIDDSFYDNYRPASPIKSKLKIVAVGNLKKDKNYEVIIDAFSIFNHQYENQVCLDVYGKGQLMESLIQRCEEKKVNNIQFKGSVTNVASLLATYDIFINSSTSEGFGLAVAEAMAVGLPVVVSNIPVLKEISFGNAFYFDPYNPKSLSDVISGIINDSFTLVEMSERGYIASLAFKKYIYLNHLAGIYSE